MKNKSMAVSIMNHFCNQLTAEFGAPKRGLLGKHDNSTITITVPAQLFDAIQNNIGELPYETLGNWPVPPQTIRFYTSDWFVDLKREAPKVVPKKPSVKLQILTELISWRQNDDGSFSPPILELSKDDFCKALEMPEDVKRWGSTQVWGAKIG